MDSIKDLNNKVILLRKSLKSILNQTKLNLAKKVKKEKEHNKNVSRKECELECFKRVKPSEIPLNLGLYPKHLYKTITSANSMEIDRVFARILLNPLIQKTLDSLKEKYELERIERFLKSNQKRVRKTELKRSIDSQKTSVRSKKDKEENDPESESFESEKSEDDSKKARKEDKKQKEKKEHRKVHREKEDENKEVKTESQKILDPFFVSTSGQNYLASITNNTSSDDDLYHDEEKYKKQTKIKRKLKNERFKPAPAIQSSVKLSKKVKTIEKSKVSLPSETNTEEELHPSWKAKQQMKKLQIQEFKGTKIKFDND